MSRLWGTTYLQKRERKEIWKGQFNTYSILEHEVAIKSRDFCLSPEIFGYLELKCRNICRNTNYRSRPTEKAWKLDRHMCGSLARNGVH